MRSFSLLLPALGVLALATSTWAAEEAAAGQELRELRQAVQQQSRQIELLAEQIGKLTRALEGHKAADPALAAPTTSIEAPEPAPEPKAELAPKAEPVTSGAKHVVAKGETLTSIAKQYNIPIAELKNANKIENERKLQIGQILTVPTAKTPETSDKKENP
jgi:LysM repeat protein